MKTKAEKPDCEQRGLKEDTRKLLISLLRRPRRDRKRSRERPRKWHPTTVNNPETGFPFTPASAREFVASTLEDGHPVQEIKLEKPPGARAYAFTIELEPHRPPLYVKLELGPSQVFGRSFHYSDRD